MASNVDKNTESEDIHRNLLVKIESCSKYKSPDLFNSEDFYTVYSPKKFILKPRDDIILNLKFNIICPKELDPWISLLPTLKCYGLTILSKTVNPEGEIELHLQNQSYYYTIKVNKEQTLAFIFLLGQTPKDLIKTEYNNVYN